MEVFQECFSGFKGMIADYLTSKNGKKNGGRSKDGRRTFPLRKIRTGSKSMNHVCRQRSGRRMSDWEDNQDVCQVLKISPCAQQSFGKIVPVQQAFFIVVMI